MEHKLECFKNKSLQQKITQKIQDPSPALPFLSTIDDSVAVITRGPRASAVAGDGSAGGPGRAQLTPACSEEAEPRGGDLLLQLCVQLCVWVGATKGIVDGEPEYFRVCEGLQVLSVSSVYTRVCTCLYMNIHIFIYINCLYINFICIYTLVYINHLEKTFSLHT